MCADTNKIWFIGSGFTTELNRRVKADNHKLWGSQCLLTEVDAVIDTYREFIQGGTDILETNTYQASIQGFQKYLGLDETESYNLIKESVDICREAIKLEKQSGTISEDKVVLVAGSVGSFGAFLADGSEYNGSFLGNYSLQEIEEWHRPRIRALVEGGVDFLAFETIPSVEEAKLLVNILSEFPNMKAWVSFSAKDESHIGCGEKFSEVAPYIWSRNPSQLVAVGVNCVAADLATELISSIENVPLVVYPNWGKIWNAEKKEWMSSSYEHDSYDDLVKKWCEMGVKYIGMCCGMSMENRKRACNIINIFNQKSYANS